MLAIVPGEPLYRIFQPDKIRLDVGFRLPGIRTKEFFRANVIGICLAAAHIGYITVFYIISRKLGAWAPQDLNYENVVSTYVPWVYPLTIGIYAATSEEFLFRLFAIPLFVAHHEVAIPGRRAARILLGISAQQLSAGTRVHSRHRSRPDRHRRRPRHAALGNLGDADLALHGGRVPHQHFLAALARRVSAHFRSDRRRRRADSAGHRRHFLHFARRIRRRCVAPEQRPASWRAADGRRRIQETEQAAPEMSPPAAAAEIPAGHAAMSSRALAVLIACGVLGVALLAGVKREAIGDFVRFQIDAQEATDRAQRGFARDQNRSGNLSPRHDGHLHVRRLHE